MDAIKSLIGGNRPETLLLLKGRFYKILEATFANSKVQYVVSRNYMNLGFISIFLLGSVDEKSFLYDHHGHDISICTDYAEAYCQYQVYENESPQIKK